MLDTTISICLLIYKYDYGDELYLYMKSNFRILIDAVDYLTINDTANPVK